MADENEFQNEVVTDAPAPAEAEPLPLEDAAIKSVVADPEPVVEQEVPTTHQGGELFTVTGDRAVYYLQPGQTGPLKLTVDQRFSLVAAGHIKPAAASN